MLNKEALISRSGMQEGPPMPANPPKPTKYKQKSNFSKGFAEKAKEYAAPIAGIGATALSYAALRGRGAKGARKKLTSVIQPEKGAKPGRVRKFIDKMIYGADDIHYTPEGMARPGRAKKIEGTVLHTTSDSPHFVKGDRNVGDITKNRAAKRMESDKATEARYIKKNAPEFAVPSKSLGSAHKGRKGLERLHKKHKNKGYVIKPRDGFGSGVGGGGFVNSSDIEKYLAGKRLPAGKKSKIENIMKNPKGQLLQEDLKIKKGLVTRQSREMRVHAVGGKVIPGASGTRAGNLEDLGRTREAEKYFQKFLDDLPAAEKKKMENVFWAPDIAMTKKGPKIIELNAGDAASGLIDPRYLTKKKGVGELAAGGAAIRKNMAIYRALTGRDHALVAGGKALGAGGAVAYGTSEAGQKKIKKGKKKVKKAYKEYKKEGKLPIPSLPSRQSN